jgi:hypothetical protein
MAPRTVSAPSAGPFPAATASDIPSSPPLRTYRQAVTAESPTYRQPTFARPAPTPVGRGEIPRAMTRPQPMEAYRASPRAEPVPSYPAARSSVRDYAPSTGAPSTGAPSRDVRSFRDRLPGRSAND